MLKQPIYYEFNLDARTSPSKLIAISHVDDKHSEVLEVAVKQNDRFVYMGGATVIARMVLHRDKDYLLSDDVTCSVNDNGNILIPFDNAVVKTSQGVVKIEVNITRDTDELTLQFPLWVSVTGSILDNAEVTPESEGTIPDLLKDAKAALDDAKEALEASGDYDNLDNKPQINGVTLSGNKTPDEFGVAGWKIAAIDNCIEDGVLYSTSINNQGAVLVLARNITTDITQYAFFCDGRVMWRTRQAETPWQPAGEWSEWEEIGGGSQIVSGVVNQNGTITFTDSDGNTFTTSGASVIGPQGAPGNDYVLTAQDKADIAGMVDISGKADKATTLAGYGITDAYTKTQTDTFFSDTNADIADLKAYIGYTDGDILGLHADFENKVFTRLGAAVGLTAGQDFNAFTMYGGRRRCNVAADGTINAYYGDADYVEDGTNGQVMVYQPAFYYKVVPLELEKNTQSNIGYHLRKANYYVSSKPVFGFKRHPLFYDEQGNPVDYVLLSAYEGSMYDVSESAYVNDGVDTSVSYGAGDLLCSVAGKKPISGKLGDIGNKARFETMANNIGSGWHLNTIKAESANQLLMLIELGRFNTQAAIGQGVVSCPSNGSYNCSSYTGSTASLGNATGMATETTYESAGTETVNTTNGKLSVTYRGVENPWGNIWKHTNGINLWGDGTMGGGQVFICDDFTYNESKHDGNYQSAGFSIANGSGYVSAFGYGDEEYDWLFMPSETTGNSSLPVGDNYWCTSNLNGYRIALLGGNWGSGGSAGGFYWICNDTPGIRYYYLGGRLLYVPTATGFGPQGPAGSNYALTAADRQAIAQIAMDGLNGNGVAY